VIPERYLREFQVKLRSKIEHLQQVSSGFSASVREKSAAVKEAAKLTKTLHECEGMGAADDLGHWPKPVSNSIWTTASRSTIRSWARRSSRFPDLKLQKSRET